MAPKASKKAAPKKRSSAKGAVVNKNWETGLIIAKFEEESWQACVCVLVGGCPHDEDLMGVLSLAVQQPQRRRFTVVSWDSMLAKIHELGNSKDKKPDNLPLYYEVTEFAKELLDDGQEIPCDLLAKIVKFQLLQIKANDQQRIEAALAEEKKATGVPALSAKDKGKKSKMAPAAVETSREKKTKLKRRDELEPPKFIDDEPDDGPQLYILLIGFYQPLLLMALDALDVHVSSVIKLNSMPQEEQTPESDKKTPDADSTDEFARKLDLFWSGLRPVLDSGPPESPLNDILQLDFNFPEVIPPVPTLDFETAMELGGQIFQGVARLIYDTLTWRRQHHHYLEKISLLNIPTVIGLDHVQPIEIIPPPSLATPSPKKKSGRVEESPPELEVKQPHLSTNVDMRFYSNLLDLVPPESCSVHLILHCMLEQVAFSSDPASSISSLGSDDPDPPSGPKLDQQLVAYMLESFLPLLHRQEEKRHMLNSLLTAVEDDEEREKLFDKFVAGEMHRKPEQPLIIRHHDKMALRFRDIKVMQCFDPAKVESSMIRLSLVSRQIQTVSQKRNNNSCWMAIKQQLQHYTTDGVVPWPEVERLFHQSVLESMPLTRLNQQGVLVKVTDKEQTAAVNPWDDPLGFASKMIEKSPPKDLSSVAEDSCITEISDELDLSDIQSCRRRSLYDWHYTEHHNAAIFPQVLQLASEEYCCMDTFRGTHNNTLYIFCHHPMTPDHQCREVWDVNLHTDVQFRKYVEHVAASISDWTKDEENKEGEILPTNLSVESLIDEKAPESAEEEYAPMPVIRKESLKAWRLEQGRPKDEDTSKKPKKENASKSKPQKDKGEAKTNDAKKNNKSGPGGKKCVEGTDNSGKSPAESVTMAAEENNEEASPGFIGYGMDGKLIHVSGQTQNLFPSDGGHIAVENISFVEGSTMLKVAVKKDGHNFYTHIDHTISDKTPSHHQNSDKHEDYEVVEPVEKTRVKRCSLSAVLENGIHLSYSVYGSSEKNKANCQETKLKVEESSIPAISDERQLTKEAEQVSSPPNTPVSQSIAAEIQSTVCESQPALNSSCFNSLNLSVPNGLLLQFLREDTQGVSSEEQGMLVRQSFPLNVKGQLPDPVLSKEVSRIITSQGAVIRSLRDGSTEVLFADGSVSFSSDSGPVWVPDFEQEEKATSQESEDSDKDQSTEAEAIPECGFWLTTTTSGARISTVGSSHRHIPATSLLHFKATDPITHEVMQTREDLVVSVQYPDGSLSVEHAEGTRITRLFRERKELESITLPSPFECACGLSECQCANLKEFYDKGEDLNTPRNTFDMDEDGHASPGMCEENMFTERETDESCVNTGEDSQFTEETDAEKDGEKSACGSVPTKEQVVLVEKEGFATVVMYPERHMAHVFLADGTVITGNNKGAYQVFPSSVGLLQIHSDGKCVYSTDCLVTPSPPEGTPTNQPGSYTMSHTDPLACDFTDPDGNHFQVFEDGRTSVLSASPAPSTKINEEEEERKREMTRLHVKPKEHWPRLFVVHEDGSGTELLSSHIVEDLLSKALADPTISLLKEPLQDTQGDFGITILKPGHYNVWSSWLLEKQNPDITPPNLKNRSWHDFPRVEKKTTGPPFGTIMGRGLTLIERSEGFVAPPVRSCPKVLEMRELYQHRPFNASLRNTIDIRLKEYIKSLMEKEQGSKDSEVKDPRSEEESVHANNLLNMVLSFAKEDDAQHTFGKRTPSDLASLYKQGLIDSMELSDVSEETDIAASDSFAYAKDTKWPERHTQNREEMEEDKKRREAYRRRIVVPYFHEENIPLFQDLLLCKTTEKERLPTDVPPFQESESPKASLRDTPQQTTPWPPNPSQSSSHAAGEIGGISQRSPIPQPPQTTGEGSLKGSSSRCRSTQVDVTGKPRRTKIRLPSCILSAKPSSLPNQKFLSVEEPVRRRCRTISLTDPKLVVRGFQLFPTSVDFGTLREGTSTAVTVLMKNVGVDTCRFQVKQPPPATGLRVIYKTGPVAAGLQVELQIQLFVICPFQGKDAELKRFISQEIIIHTETDILYLPVTATILSERLYNDWLKNQSGARKKTRSRLLQVTPSPPGGQGGAITQHNTFLKTTTLTTGAQDLTSIL